MIALISDSQSKTLFDNSKLLIIVNKKEIPKIGFLFDCPEILFKERDRIGRTQMFRKCIRKIYKCQQNPLLSHKALEGNSVTL